MRLVCALLTIVVSVLSPLGIAAALDRSIDVAAWVATWPRDYTIEGGKSEPTYVEAISIARRGDAFSVTGGAPAWERRSVEAVSVEANGRMIAADCPKRNDCAPAVDFLSSAALLAAFRAHRPLGRATPMVYGDRQVVCLPAERIGVAEAVLDPCFDLETGAVLAQRSRYNGKFDGPSLDPGSIRIIIEPATAGYRAGDNGGGR